MSVLEESLLSYVEESPELNAYDLITDELVNGTLQADFGAKTKLLSWQSKDFTKKGDNYSSIVTSIEVKYEVDGKLQENSYVVKLNPLRQMNDFTELMDATYEKEVVVLSDILQNGLSKELKKLNLDPIAVPKIYAWNLNQRKQAFVTEDLRKLNFVMFDRRKGMDVNHALLVVEELGRFHSTSILYQNTLENKSIKDSFKCFEEPWDKVESVKTVFSKLIEGQCQNAAKLLKDQAPKYKVCAEWLDKNVPHLWETWLDLYKAEEGKSTIALSHGDCWTNNILFRYNEEGKPVELRFVDLQGSRMCSPANDLNYFFYSSLDGKTRKTYKKLLLATYYTAYWKIFLLTDKKPPLSFKDLEKEVNDSMMMGMFSGIFLLPIVMAEDDEIMDVSKWNPSDIDEFVVEQERNFFSVAKKGDIFNDRFLSMFDEMIEAKVFEKDL